VAVAQSQWAYSMGQASTRGRRRPSRRARRNRLLLALALVLLGMLVVPWAVRASAGHAAAPVLVTVQPGDTLWEIAGRFTPVGADRRPLVFEIGRLNHLPDGGLVQPGQTLVVPGQS